ncbi:MAG: amidase [Burkholderiales bacterium]
MPTPSSYDPARFKPRTFFDAVPAFRSGQDDPCQYLERCLEVIAEREPTVQAWVIMNERGAREAADASARRWREGRPLSPIDGMPIGIKDLIETKDMPTQMGCAAFEGHFPKSDSASVRALRDAGAIILGKLVTTELAAGLAGPTTNPFNPLHTPGSSSSGPAAAVGAGMIPVAIGTQVGGSVIRPASYCANWALKPTLGALNRGERLTYSHGTLGIHGGSLQDIWPVAIAMSQRAGGDPGRPGLFGPPDTPLAAKPQRLILMETGGWADLDKITREALEQVLAQLQNAGVEIVRRTDSALLDVFEQRIASMNAVGNDITAFELRPLLENLVEAQPDKISPRLLQKLEQGRKLTLDDYRARLLACEEARHRFTAIAPLGDALISVSSSGPAPLGTLAGTHPAATTVFNAPASMLGAPAVTVPLLAIGGLPVGVQLVGQQHADAGMIGMARWLGDNIPHVIRQ